MQALDSPPVRGPVTQRPRTSTASRFGYLVGVVVNAILIVIVNNLLAWGWVPFLTGRFELLTGIITVSLSVVLVANVLWLAFDPRWFKAMLQLGLNAISLVVAMRIWQVFPFDFSAYPGFSWHTMARVVIVVSMVGICVGMLSELFKLLSPSSWEGTSGT